MELREMIELVIGLIVKELDSSFLLELIALNYCV